MIEEFPPTLGSLPFSDQDGGDFFPFCDDERIIDVAMGLNLRKNLDRFIKSVDFSEPSRGAWKEWKANHEYDSRNELNPPSGSERRRSWNERAAVPDEEHDENAPLNGKLLDDDERTALLLFSYLCEVDRNLRGSNSDTDSIEKATSDEHTESVDCSLDGGTN